jgi:hypothetical protein
MTQKFPVGGFSGYMVMGSGGILNAKKDPAVQNLGLFGMKLMSLWPYKIWIEPRGQGKYKNPL